MARMTCSFGALHSNGQFPDMRLDGVLNVKAYMSMNREITSL